MWKFIYGGLFVSSVALGFFTPHEHPVFPWHEIPSLDAATGIFGSLLLLAAAKLVDALARRGENFYD